MFEINFQEAGKLSANKLHELILFRTTMLLNGVETNRRKYPDLDYDKIEKQIQEFGKGINVVINLNELTLRDYNLNLVKNLINCSNLYNLPLNIYVVGGSRFNSTEKVDLLFKDNEFEKLEKLDMILRANNKNPLKFMDSISNPEKAWTISQVKNANNKIDEIVRFIRANKFSPLETMAYIHSVATLFTYNENEKDFMQSRTLVGITNSNHIVCVGYATFIKAIIDKLNIHGLSCENFSSTFTQTDDALTLENGEKLPGIGSGHSQCMITIHDFKYRIKGTYIDDACFDSRDNQYPNGRGYANFMFPVTDLLTYKGYKFNQPTDISSLIDQLLGTDQEVDPQQLPVIRDYAKHSQPIKFEILRNALIEVYKKLLSNYDDKHIARYVDMIIEASMENSRTTFTSEAQNAIAVKTYEQKKPVSEPAK